jgi:hypothetical protein
MATLGASLAAEAVAGFAIAGAITSWMRARLRTSQQDEVAFDVE